MKSAKIFMAFTFVLAFAACVSAQVNHYPNEIKGYEFFEKRKLRDLQLGVSTIEDVIRNFGEECTFGCSYSRNWTVSFSYFSSITRVKTLNDKKIEYVSDPSFNNTLYSVTLRPKSDTSSQRIILSPNFTYKGKGEFSFSKNDNYETLSLDVYSDDYGLEYSIFDKIITKNQKASNLKNGDLFSITYKITDELREKLFTKRK